jgi:FK506-binding protein 2
MRAILLPVSALAIIGFVAAQDLKIEVTFAVKCDRKTKNGDIIYVNYNGTLTDGKEFDSSMFFLTTSPR